MATCSSCGKRIEIGWWPMCEQGHEPTRGRDAQDFIPPVVFQNAEGHTLFPGRSDEKPPAGYQAVELRTTSEIRKFEREFGERLHNDEQNNMLLEQLRHDFYQRPKAQELRTKLDRLPPNLRAYAEAALARHDRRSFSTDATRQRPAAFFEAFSNDASNRERCDDPKIMLERQRR